MNKYSLSLSGFLVGLLMIGIGFAPHNAQAQLDANLIAASIENDTDSQIEAFYAQNGGRSQFPQITQDVMVALMNAEDAVSEGDYSAARGLIDDFLAKYPLTSSAWNYATYPSHLELGRPAGYYGIRMLDEITRQGLANQGKASRPLTFTIVTVSCAEGFQPTSLRTSEGFDENAIRAVSHTLDPAIRNNDHFVVRQAAQLFQQYIHAITSGERHLELRFVEEGDLCGIVNSPTGGWWIGLNNTQQIVDSLPDYVKDSSDMYWVIYPSNIPEDPIFEGVEFISSATNRYDGRTVFMMDDRWILKKPLHLGTGVTSEVERRVYHPQWMQHEYFHHLFKAEFPEFELEKIGHQWFSASNWPDDFTRPPGREADYYSEALHKRFYGASPSIAERLSHAQISLSIPGKIEAEYFTEESGTIIEPTNDIGGGSNVGYIEQGDYLSYTAHVIEAGDYELQIRVASPHTNTGINVSLSQGGYQGKVNVPNTGGWQDYTTEALNLYLPAGNQTIRLDFTGGTGSLLNLNWLNVVVPTPAYGVLDRNDWSVNASSNNAKASFAIDSSASTRWDTATKQVSGQSFEIDLGSVATFNAIALEASDSPNDYPRGYAVYVSDSGDRWGNAVASGSGSGATTVIDFSSVSARYIKIEQTGTTDSYWWSIHDLNVIGSYESSMSEELDSTNWSLFASRTNDDVYNAIDQVGSTRWSTRETQRSGQSFTIDMNETHSINKIVLDSANSNLDQPRGYEVYVSTDGLNFGNIIASGEGSADGNTEINFSNVNARFIRIVQTGSDNAHWWSIHELSVYGQR